MGLFPRSTIPRLAAVVIFAGVASCGSSTHKSGPATTAATAPAAPAPASTASLTIKNFSFSPTPLSAKAGTAISITNNDSTDHTVTDNNGGFDTGHIAPGSSKTIMITKAGTYNFHCSIHTFMKGAIQVTT